MSAQDIISLLLFFLIAIIFFIMIDFFASNVIEKTGYVINDSCSPLQHADAISFYIVIDNETQKEVVVYCKQKIAIKRQYQDIKFWSVQGKFSGFPYYNYCTK